MPLYGCRQVLSMPVKQNWEDGPSFQEGCVQFHMAQEGLTLQPNS